MATSIREGLLGKEKTIPQQANPAQDRASPNPFLSPSRPIGANLTSTTEKSISNHMRRIRGRIKVDQPMKREAAKKPATSSNKPRFASLRSSNKNSPNTSQSTRTRESRNLKEKSMHTSSSFSRPRSSGKTLRKATSSGIAKTAAKDVEKQHSLSARPLSLKKSNNIKNKKNSRSFATSSRISPTPISSSQRVEGPETVSVPHPQEDDPQPSVTDEEVSSNELSSHATNEQVPIDTLYKHEIPVDVATEKERRQTDAPVQVGVEGPESVTVSHPQEGDPQPSVTDEEVSINGLSSHVTDEQVPIDALRNTEMPPDVAKEKEQRQTDAPMQAEPYIHERKDIKINKTAPIKAEPYIDEKEDIKIIKTPTFEVGNKDATNSSINTEEAKHQKVPSKETCNFHLESQLLQEQLQVNSTNSINKKIIVQAEDQAKEVAKDASKGSTKTKEAEHHNIPGKGTNNFHHESQLLQKQFQVNSTDSINKNIEVQEKGQGKEEVKDVLKGSMKAEETEQHNAPGKETSRFHLESQQVQEQPKAKNDDPVNENLEVQAKDQGKVEVKDITEPMKKKEELTEENRVVSFGETEDVKNIASLEL